MNYFLTDHLGCVRVIVDGSGTVKERNDYYSFGARHVRADYPQREGNRYKYNGKEDQVTGNLEYLDYGWRMLDKTLGRWFCMDPKSEKYYSFSPYAHVLNNPLGFVDLDGMDSWSTSNPAVISQFMNSLKSRGNVFESFNYKSFGWSHMSDKDFFTSGRLYYDDETRLFSYSFWQDNQIIRLTRLADMQMSGVASILDHQQAMLESWMEFRLRWWIRSSGKVEQDYTLDAFFIPVGKGLGILMEKGGEVIAKTGASALTKTGIQFSKHSLERLARRGITQDMAELAISKGQKFYDPFNKSINYVLPNCFGSGKSLLVGTNPLTGEVTTVIRSSKNLVNKRFIPIQ